MKKIGNYTIAITLIAIGGAVLADRIYGSGGWLKTALSWWPAILIMLGIEMVLLKAGKDADGNQRRFDGKIIVLVVAVFIASQVYNTGLPIAATVNSLIEGTGTSLNWAAGEEKKVLIKEDTMTAEGMERLIIDNNVGRVLVTGSERKDIYMKATARVHTSSQSEAEEKAKKVRLETSVGQEYKINVIHEGTIANGVAVDLELEVPSRLKAEISTKVGAIEASSLAALKVTDNTGSVKADTIDGDVQIKTTTGKIDIERVKGKAELKTTTGAISAALIEGKLEAFATTGPIRFEETASDVKAETTTGQIEGSLSRPIAGNYELKATTGKISLDLPTQSSATFKAHSNTGAIDGSLPWIVNKEGLSKDGSATLGSGQYHVDLKAATGHISVNAD